MTTEFAAFGLHPQLEQAISERGYAAPTPIQSGIIPLMLAGRDVIGQAQTGTGKTAAFALPILHRLTPGHGAVQALVVAPTRELALQVAKAMYEYGRHRDIRVLSIYGGTPYGRQISRLSRGVDVVVGTPGRLLDLIRQGSLALDQLQTVVLDEADEMLSMGFIEDIEAILQATPAARQTALFSATMPTEIRRLADKYLNEPQSVTIEGRQLTVEAIEQRYYLVNTEADKLAALTRLFEVEPVTSALIFARTRLATGQLAADLTVRGFPAESLNGDLSQEAREQVMNRFRNGQVTVLVATDVAARGLDIDDISHVFNFDLPLDAETYVHRVGRTARAGKSGLAISLLTPQERWRLRKIERYTRQTITKTALPTVSDIENYRETQLLESMMVWLRRGRCLREKELIGNLVEEGHDLLEIAAAALKMARAEEKQRPIAPLAEVQLRPERPERGRRERATGYSRANGHGYGRGNGHENGQGRGRWSNTAQEKGMVRLSLSAGKAHGVRPNDVVGAIAFHAGMPGSAIGAIRIAQQHTLVDIPEKYVAQVLDNSGRTRLRREVVTVERAG
jgi:ATP-dependent RNA helicase DeaD